MTQHLRHSVFSGRRAGESGGVALDDVTATEAGVLEGEPPRAGELLGELLGAWPLQPSDSYGINPVVASERLGCSGGIAVRGACEHAGVEPGGPGLGDLAELVEPSRVEAKVSSLRDPATPEPGRRRSAAGQVPIAGREPGLGRPVVQGRDLVGLGSRCARRAIRATIWARRLDSASTSSRGTPTSSAVPLTTRVHSTRAVVTARPAGRAGTGSRPSWPARTACWWAAPTSARQHPAGGWPPPRGCAAAGRRRGWCGAGRPLR